jgi:hypothetical protein
MSILIQNLKLFRMVHYFLHFKQFIMLIFSIFDRKFQFFDSKAKKYFIAWNNLGNYFLIYHSKEPHILV